MVVLDLVSMVLRFMFLYLVCFLCIELLNIALEIGCLCFDVLVMCCGTITYIKSRYSMVRLGHHKIVYF